VTSPGATRHRGKIVDLFRRRVFPGYIEVAGGKISAVREDHSVTEQSYLCPGFVDAHVHIESSMLTPPEFARIAVIHGTVATVSDPHEIANVLGTEGVRYMQKLAAQTPCKIHFGIPSCVPATNFETAGATLGPEAVEELCADPSLVYLSEMMNFPGVIHRDPDVMRKIDIAKKHGKRIDGHAPGLRGTDLEAYVAAGIETDHECFQLEEALEKLALGQKILIREGSAAKNFGELWPLLNEHPDRCMLCSDDKHPDDLMEGHINSLCARAVAKGVQMFNVLRAACLNPVEHYGLRSGLMRPGRLHPFARPQRLQSRRDVDRRKVRGPGRQVPAAQDNFPPRQPVLRPREETFRLCRSRRTGHDPRDRGTRRPDRDRSRRSGTAHPRRPGRGQPRAGRSQNHRGQPV
jgi:adenine deaminase